MRAGRSAYSFGPQGNPRRNRRLRADPDFLTDAQFKERYGDPTGPSPSRDQTDEEEDAEFSGRGAVFWGAMSLLACIAAVAVYALNY